MELKLDRTKETIVNVPDDAEFVMDLTLEIVTTKVWDTVAGKYRLFKLRTMKVWAKQPDGKFKLQFWPCDTLYPNSHRRQGA